jgi:hypothetical protein
MLIPLNRHVFLDENDQPTVNKKGKFKKVVSRFDSARSFINYLDQCDYSDAHWYGRDSKTSKIDPAGLRKQFTFSGYSRSDTNESLVRRTYERARVGNIKQLKKLQRIAKESGISLKGRLEDSERSKQRWSPVGRGHIPAYLQGNPMPNTRGTIVDRTLPTATLAINLAANCTTEAKEIEAYATGALAAIQTVCSASRVQLAVYIAYAGEIYPSSTHTCAIRLKQYDKPINLSHAAAVMCDPSFYRLFGFSWFALIDKIPMTLGQCSKHVTTEAFDENHRLVSITPDFGVSPVQAYKHVCSELREAMNLK